jgi:hypothetical protein
VVEQSAPELATGATSRLASKQAGSSASEGSLAKSISIAQACRKTQSTHQSPVRARPAATSTQLGSDSTGLSGQEACDEATEQGSDLDRSISILAIWQE